MLQHDGAFNAINLPGQINGFRLYEGWMACDWSTCYVHGISCQTTATPALENDGYAITCIHTLTPNNITQLPHSIENDSRI